MKNKKNKYIGIDPGVSGSIVVLDDGNIIDAIKMPVVVVGKSRREYDVPSIVEFLSKHSDGFVVIEKVHAMKHFGVVTSFRMGYCLGMLVGIITSLKMRHQLVHSKTWQKEMYRDIDSTNKKNASKIIAQRLFPDYDFTPTERSKKVDDNTTDATLLAVWGQRKSL